LFVSHIAYPDGKRLKNVTGFRFLLPQMGLGRGGVVSPTCSPCRSRAVFSVNNSSAHFMPAPDFTAEFHLFTGCFSAFSGG